MQFGRSSGSSFNLSRWAIEHPSLTRFFFVLVVLAGIFSALSMGRKEDPDFTFRVMIVQVSWPGSSLHDMQDQVVDKLERKLQEVPHLDYLRSFTRAGSAIITISIRGDAFGRDVTDAFYQARKKVADIQQNLPEGVLGPYFNDEFGDTYIALFSFSGAGFAPIELEDTAKRARDQFLRIPGVEKAQILGARDQTIHVDVPSKVLAERGLTALSIRDAINGQNAISASGRLETSERSVRISVDGGLSAVEDLAELRLRAGTGVIRLGDIATITRGYADPPDRIFRDGGREAVMLGVVMAKGANVTKVGEDLHTALAGFNRDLPYGMEVSQIADQPKVVEHAIDEFAEALGEALVIVLAVSFISIGWRAGLVVAITIPFVLAATFAVMLQMGIDLQRISLGALIIALGLLVDDAMIAVEMMERKLEEGFDKVAAASFAYTSTAFPMLSGTLITTAGFIPVGFANSTAGEYVSSLFWVVGIALVVSWIAAVYFTPWIGTMILKERPHAEGEHRELFGGRFYRILRGAIGFAVDHRILVVAVTLAIFVGSLSLFRFVPQSFFPASTRPEVLIDLWLPEGTGIAETERQAVSVEKQLLADPDQVQVTTFVGEGAPRFYLPLDIQLRNPNFAQILVVAKDIESRERLINRTRKLLTDDYPAIRFKVDRLFNGPPVGWAVQLRVQGPDRVVVRDIADKVKAAFDASPLLSSVHDDWLEPVPTMRLVIDQDKARALGVTSSNLRQIMQATFSGAPIGSFRDGETTVSIVFREPAEGRTALTSLDETYIPLGNGAVVPLSQVARIETTLESGIEWRRNRLSTITVRGLIPDDIQSNVVTTALFDQLKPLRDALPAGYRIEMQGAVEESATSQDSIAAKAPTMLFFMAVLLMLQLQHFGKSLLVFLTAPLGLIGAVGALLATNSAFGFVAILGVIALAGIIMRNSIILIDQITQDIAAGEDPRTATIESTIRRFRPIMLTAAAAVLALIPIAQSAFWGPMAYAMMGGILVATVLTIIVLPAAWALAFRVPRGRKAAAAAPVPQAAVPAAGE